MTPTENCMNELDIGYIYAIKESRIPNGHTNRELYRLMANCIEQYRREKMQEITHKIGKGLCTALDIGEEHLHKKGTLEERLTQIVEEYKKF